MVAVTVKSGSVNAVTVKGSILISYIRVWFTGYASGFRWAASSALMEFCVGFTVMDCSEVSQLQSK